MTRLIVIGLIGLLILPSLASSDEGNLFMFKCELMSGVFEIDPADAQTLVPKEYELALSDKKKAIVRFYVSSNCQEATFNKEDISSKDFGYAEVNIDIQGPPELPKIEGAQANSLTRYHYTLWQQVAGVKADRFLHAIRKLNLPIKRVDQITMDKFEHINTPCDISGRLVESGPESAVIWKEKLAPVMPGRMVGIKIKESYNRDDGKSEHTVVECLVTVGQMGSLNIEAHPETMLGKTFGETITGKAIEHSQNCECTIWFGSPD